MSDAVLFKHSVSLEKNSMRGIWNVAVCDVTHDPWTKRDGIGLIIMIPTSKTPCSAMYERAQNPIGAAIS